MKMSSESEFLAALLALQPIVEEPIEYRIYYNENGRITQCSLRGHPKDGNYLVVTAEEYNNYFRYTVVEGRLKRIDVEHNFHVKLTKADCG